MDFKINDLDRGQVFKKVANYIQEYGLSVVSKDFERPWGGFFVIEESQAKDFASLFFPEVAFESLKLSEKLSPKFLVVAPEKRLSWQYHHRRAEIWTVLSGDVGVVRSDTDTEGELIRLKKGDQIKLHQGERHRLIGLGGWSVLAEIWQHIDATNPSNEEDIVRVQDDFGR
jgi:mannose-6-phosphate isomerase-like protein (cupin superfamily)